MSKIIGKVVRNAVRPWRWRKAIHRLLHGGNHPLVSKAKEHLTEVLEAGADLNLPDLGRRWAGFSNRLLKERLPNLETPEQMIQYGQSPEAGIETHLPEADLKGMLHYYQLLIFQEFSQFAPYLSSFQASDLSHPSHIVTVNGQRLDFSSLFCALYIFRCLSVLGDHSVDTICEIGGGTGDAARAWLTNPIKRPKHYCIIDIPETLIFSEVLLRHEFGDSNVLYVRSNETLKPDSIPTILLCPVNHMQALEPLTFNLVINTGSMQEMSEDWIDYYMTWLDRQPCDFFYSNNFFGSPLDLMREGGNSWSPRPSPLWQLRFAQTVNGGRPIAELVYQRGNTNSISLEGGEHPSLTNWLRKLEVIRLDNTEESLVKGLDYATSVFPYVPKEAWLLAKRLKESGHPKGKEVFPKLHQLRSNGVESVY